MAPPIFRPLPPPSTRKRIRYDSDDVPIDGPYSPAPLVNTAYRLADGGLANFNDDENNNSSNDSDNYSSNHDLHSRKRSRSSHNYTPGWGRSVMSLVGGVAGRVWDFCWAGPLRGFYAGGGSGYDLKKGIYKDTSGFKITRDLEFEDSGWEDARMPHSAPVHTPIPGHFPDDDDPLVTASAAPTLGDGAADTHDDLQTSWMLVHNKLPSRETSPLRPARKVSRRSSTPRLTPRPSSARRQPLTPVRPSCGRFSTGPGLSPSHRRSNSHPRTQPQPPPGTPNSPRKTASPRDSASIEAARMAAAVRRREREEDASLSRLNEQLRAMIREGREALGTRVEIGDDE